MVKRAAKSPLDETPNQGGKSKRTSRGSRLAAAAYAGAASPRSGNTTSACSGSRPGPTKNVSNTVSTGASFTARHTQREISAEEVTPSAVRRSKRVSSSSLIGVTATSVQRVTPPPSPPPPPPPTTTNGTPATAITTAASTLPRGRSSATNAASKEDRIINTGPAKRRRENELEQSTSCTNINNVAPSISSMNTINTVYNSLDSIDSSGGYETAMLSTLLPLAQLGRREAHHNQTDESINPFEQLDDGGEVDYSFRCPLEEMFLALEQIIPLFRRRRQATLFKQVKAAVEGMCGRSFTRQHLAQIVSVQPDAYKISSKTDARPTRGGYLLRDLLIEIGPDTARGSTGTKKSGLDLPKAEIGLDMNGGSAKSRSNSNGERSRTGGGGVSMQRKEVFHQLLVAARARHCKCEKDLKEQSMATAGKCSCFPEAPLPDTSPLPVDLSGRQIAGGVESSTPPSAICGTLADPGFHGVDGSEAPKDVDALRERLKQKDSQSAREQNKTEDEKEADRRRKGNLPAIADALRSFFAHSRRTTCPLDAVVDALSSSSRHALSVTEARDRVRMLAGVVPEWCAIIAPPATAPGGGGGKDRYKENAKGVINFGSASMRPTRGREMVRVNTRLHFGEVRQMIAFMAGSGGG